MAANIKFCLKCEADLPLTDFYKNRSKKDGFSSWCKSCTRESNTPERNRRYAVKAKAKHPDETRALWQRRTRMMGRYGLTLEDYDAMLADQCGVCALCLRDPGYRLHVDHNHETGEVRGLLCAKCNAALGWYEKRAAVVGWYLQPREERVLGC